MSDNRNRCYVNFNDRDNPVAGSAADKAKREREAKAEKELLEGKKEIDKASRDFPAFGRIMELLKKDE